VAIDFRQPPEAIYPASIADVNLGVRWLKAHARDFNGSAEAVGGLGTSSGGHQIMLVALRPHDPRYAALHLDPSAPPELDARLSYVILCWPVLDPLARYRWAKARGNDDLVARHDGYWQTETAMAEGNPQHIVEQGAEVPLPPALLIQGTNDDNIPMSIPDRFTAAYRQRGGFLQLETFEGLPHRFINTEPDSPATARALGLMRAFVREQAGGRIA
jgi:acetyl esterase/lipase